MSTDDKNESVEFLRYSETTSFEEIDSYEEISEDSSEPNVEIQDESIENVSNLPTNTVISSSNSPFEFSSTESCTSSWSETIEAFLDQLNDIDFDSDYERDIMLKRGLGELIRDESEDECGDENEVIHELRSGQRFLVCLAVPVLLSQLLMLLILSSSNGLNAKSSVIVHPITSVKTIHYHHHHHYYYEQEDKPPKGFTYIFFNPFAAIYNSRYFKITSEWLAKEYRKQLNDPKSFVSHISHYIHLYLDSIKTSVLKLNSIMKSGLDNEVGKALRIRDNWNRAVYNKIYEITSTPQYQHAVSTINKWKDRLFS